MKASIVIPAHNEEQFIEKTIRAALAQDYGDFEVIVVNNGSTDRTAEIAATFPVKVVNESRKGLLWARERGRREAKGEIIANIDSDCLPEPVWLSSGIAHLSNDRAVAVTGPYDYHDAGSFFRFFSLLTQKYLYSLASKITQSPFIRKGALLIGGNNLIRAWALEKSGGYNTSLDFYGEDTDTAKRISKYGKVVFNPAFVMKTSARRFKDEGVFATEAKYIYHFLRHAFFNRS